MPIDVKVPESDGWWLARLARKLELRQPRLAILDAYFRGDPPLPTGAENAKAAYQAFQRKARTNFAELIVEALRERMAPTGFRTGAGGDENGDKVAWKLWTRNGLDVEFADVLQSMLSMGDGYMIAGPDGAITGEDPRQVVTAHDPVQQRKVVAALKVFHDPLTERDLAYLYLPGRLRVAYRATRRVGNVRFSPAAWSWDDDLSADFPEELADVVPVVRFRNKRGVGEFEPHLDLLDRINHMLLQRMVIATMQAFRQRAIKGDLPATYPAGHPQAGDLIDYNGIFVADPGALWTIPASADIWESGQADLTPILSSVKDDVMHLAAVTRTPLHMLTPDAANGSAEGASLMREGLVFRGEDRIKRATNGLIDVMVLAFRFLEDTQRADRDALEVLWAPVERRSLAERADAAAKATDLPWRARMTEIWQFPPAVVDQMEIDRAMDALLAPAAPAVPATAAPTAP